MLNQIVNDMGNKQFINWHETRRCAEYQLSRLNIDIDVKKRVRELPLAQKQMVLIARSLVLDSKFLILDEPTAPLSNTEVDELFRILKDIVTKEGVGIIFVSHRLPEVFLLCDDITIMRDTRIITAGKTSEMTIETVVENMLGRQFGNAFPKYDITLGDKLLEVNNLTSHGNEIQNINMYVRRGEIVGIAGLVGAGKSELCKTLFSGLRKKSGSVTLANKRLKCKTPHQAVHEGIALVPEERRKEGILLNEPIFSNLSIAKLSKFCSKFGFVKKYLERLNAIELIKKLGIKTPDEQKVVRLLSGGNQQKIVVGKWISADADIYIFDEATKGVDVGAKQDIFKLIGDVASQGKGVLYASCEINEILGLTDRIYVMYDHCIVSELITRKTDEKEILYLATGGMKHAQR
jgi:simple sugar transport system ATP-binding protein